MKINVLSPNMYMFRNPAQSELRDNMFMQVLHISVVLSLALR